MALCALRIEIGHVWMQQRRRHVSIVEFVREIRLPPYIAPST